MRRALLLPEHAAALRSFTLDFHPQGETSIPAFFQSPAMAMPTEVAMP